MKEAASRREDPEESMAKIVGLPKLSPTMEVGTLVRWVKRKGERVEVDDLLAEVETDKATMEFRSFDRGVLLEVLAPEGATLRPETPVAILGEPGEDVAPLLATLRPMGPHPSHAEPTPVVAGGNVGPAGHAVAAQGMAKTASPVEAAAPAGDAGGAARVPASPLVRRLARERGVDLRVIAGSGPRGRVVLRDLEAYLREVARGPSAPVPEAARSTAVGQATADRVVPVGSMRRTIARRLTEAKRDVPHYYLTIDVDAGPLVELRAQINAALVESGEKVTLTDLLVRACALALSRH
ncbi:MAG: biotin/lipoyl-containing protein, partial [Myxococcales bacterium]|nr:biotin/lipoyl-containing protein [Myxococcales bacterium]